MQDWLKAFHGANQPFPAMEIAVKAAVALALGLLVGLEREWSNKRYRSPHLCHDGTARAAWSIARHSVATAQRCCGPHFDSLCQSSRLTRRTQIGSHDFRC